MTFSHITNLVVAVTAADILNSMRQKRDRLVKKIINNNTLYPYHKQVKGPMSCTYSLNRFTSMKQ